jgi:hypothetical protein
MNTKKELITEEQTNKLLKHATDSNNSNREQLLRLIQDMQIALDDSAFEDTIDGTRIRVTHMIEINRKGMQGERRDNILRLRYIKEIPINYNKVPVSFKGNSTDTASPTVPELDTVTHFNDKSDDPTTESYNALDEGTPTLYEILGLLKRLYFMPEDFSNRLTVERIHTLRTMFTKDEIFAFPSVSLDDKAGLIPA